MSHSFYYNLKQFNRQKGSLHYDSHPYVIMPQLGGFGCLELCLYQRKVTHCDPRTSSEPVLSGDLYEILTDTDIIYTQIGVLGRRQCEVLGGSTLVIYLIAEIDMYTNTVMT